MNVIELLQDTPFKEKAADIAHALTSAGITADNLDDAPRLLGGHPAGADVYLLVATLREKLAAEPESDSEPDSGTIGINLADGVDNQEATIAGQALAQRKRQKRGE